MNRNKLMASALVLLTLMVGRATVSQEKDSRQAAIDRGVAFLKAQQQKDGTWKHPEKIGLTALVGFTLLECGVPRDDPIIRSAAKAVRQAVPRMTHTYSLSLSLVFLDRLGRAADVPLIESLAVRLLAGQNSNAGWSYHCPSLTSTEAKRLGKIVGMIEKTKEEGDERKPKELSKEVQQQLEAVEKGQFGFRDGSLGDTSNTAFASMALARAKQFLLPAEKHLALTELRLLKSQEPDMGWSYLPTGMSETTLALDVKENPQGQPEMPKEIKRSVKIPLDNEVYAILQAQHVATAPDLVSFYKRGQPELIAVVVGWGKTPAATALDWYPPQFYTFRAGRLSNGCEINNHSGGGPLHPRTTSPRTHTRHWTGRKCFRR